VNDLAHILKLRAAEMPAGSRFVVGYPGCPPHGLDGQPEDFMEEALGSLLDDGTMTQAQLAAIPVQLYLPRPCEVRTRGSRKPTSLSPHPRNTQLSQLFYLTHMLHTRPPLLQVHSALAMVDDLWEVEAGFGAEADTLLLPGWQAYTDGEITAAELGEQYSEVSECGRGPQVRAGCDCPALPCPHLAPFLPLARSSGAP
jgi:hypothetical protein